MLVNITGGNKHLRSLAHSLVDYCAEHLFPNNLKNKIILDIEFSKTLYKEDGILGEIDFDDSNHRPQRIYNDPDCAGSKTNCDGDYCT